MYIYIYQILETRYKQVFKTYKTSPDDKTCIKHTLVKSTIAIPNNHKYEYR